MRCSAVVFGAMGAGIEVAARNWADCGGAVTRVVGGGGARAEEAARRGLSAVSGAERAAAEAARTGDALVRGLELWASVQRARAVAAVPLFGAA